MTNLTRPGASSSTVWIAPASTEGWRVNGLVTAGNSVSREVAAAAWPSTTNVSRDSIWLSRIPAPSKPAASMDRSRRMRSGIGAVPGTRRWTRTGSIRAVGYELEGRRIADVGANGPVTADLRLRKTQDLAAQLTNAEWLASMPGTDDQKKVLLGCVQCHTLERTMRSTHDAAGFLKVQQRMGTYVNQSTPLHIQVRRAERLLEMRGEEQIGRAHV